MFVVRKKRPLFSMLLYHSASGDSMKMNAAKIKFYYD
jgi:hypothetical protein